jgi:membrane protein
MNKAYWNRKWRELRAVMHRQTLPGFSGIPIAIIFKYVWKEILRDDIMVRSNSMAYSFFLSIFPGLLVILSLLPYLPVDNMVSAFQRNYVDLLPDEMASYINVIIIEMTKTPKSGLLSLSLLLALVFASNGVGSMIKGFHKSYEMTYRKQNILQREWRAIYLTMLLGLLFLSSLIAIVIGKPILVKWLSSIGLSGLGFGIYNYLKWVLVFIFYYFVISIIYRIGPAFRTRPKLFTPGATLATILSVISSVVFSLYVENFFRYNEIYGSIGALILILVWLQINSFIILLGYELNASIAINRDLLAQEEI